MEDQPEDSDRSFLVACNFFLGAIFVSAFIANVLVLMVFYRKSGLRSIANRFVVNLMIINLVSCLSLLPLSLADNSVTSSDKFLCVATELSSVFCSSVIIFAVLLIALDQYCAVVDPLHYHRVINSCKCNCMIISSWCISALFAVLDGVQPTIDEGEYSVFRHCGLSSGDTLASNVTEVFADTKTISGSGRIYRFVFCTVFALSVFAVPFVLICFIYYRICAAASGNTKRTRTSCVNTEESVHSAKEKLDADSNASEKEDYLAIVNELQKRENVANEQLETSTLLARESESAQESGANPSFVLTRPSPPKCVSPPAEQATDESAAAVDAAMDAEAEEISETVKSCKTDVPFLKPTLKNNSSFSKLSSLHIQFSSFTEEISDERMFRSGRRHSNTSVPVVDPEFENISKSRSPSIQSNSFEIPSGSSPQIRSTFNSSQIKSSRSSSINSSSTRHPASRASSIRSTSSYIVHNIRHRISNASLFRYREEARAARISALVIVMALVCWLPFFTVFYLHSGIELETVPGKRSFPLYLDSFSIAFLLLSAVVSPFLFAFRNRKVKKEIRKIINFRRSDIGAVCAKSFYKYNFSVDIKSQTMQLFLGSGKKSRPDYQLDGVSRQP